MVIDTNIVIAHLAGESNVVREFSLWKKMGLSLVLSSIAEMETLAYPGLTTGERRIIESYLEDTYTSIVFDRSIARIGGHLRSEKKISFADAAIAATALYTHTPLVTRNVKDFKKIPDLRIIEI